MAVKAPVHSLEGFLPFSRPTVDEAAIAEVVDSLRSGWLTMGPKVIRFEAMLSEYFDAPYALTVSSATAGLFLALQALNFAPGDEVITTPLTFVATLNIIVHNGLTPVLVDIDPSSYNLDIGQIEAKITPRTKAIIPVHFAGLAVDMTALYQIAERYNLRVIEDAAHAIGTTYQGQRIGSFGDIQVFSFHPNKNITTGEGGCVVTRDAQVAEKVKLLRLHGMNREAWNRFAKNGSPHYEVVAAGYKFNMTDLQAALGIHQLPRLEEFIARRRLLAERYYTALDSINALTLPLNDDGHAWHIFAPLVCQGSRDELMDDLKANNIGTALHFQAVHLHPFYQKTYGWQRGDFPNAEQVGDTIVSLPLFPLLTELEQDQVIRTLKELL